MIRFALCLLFSGVAWQCPATDPVAETALGKTLAKFVDKNASSLGFSGAVFAAREGEVVYADAVGLV